MPLCIPHHQSMTTAMKDARTFTVTTAQQPFLLKGYKTLIPDMTPQPLVVLVIQVG